MILDFGLALRLLVCKEYEKHEGEDTKALMAVEATGERRDAAQPIQNPKSKIQNR